MLTCRRQWYVVVGTVLLLVATLLRGDAAVTVSPERGWLVYYGAALAADDLRGVAHAVVDPENNEPRGFPDYRGEWVAYLSVGEAEEYRAYWPRVVGAAYLLDANRDWAGNRRVDLRAPEWQRMLLEEVVPSIVARGFHGLFLDTIDVPLELERDDSRRFAGSRAALVTFVEQLHARFPQLLLYSNNGFEVLDALGPWLAGAFAEDVYTRYDPTTRAVMATPSADRDMKEAALDRFRTRFAKPVVVLLYSEAADAPLVQDGRARAVTRGYAWYVAPGDLQRVGTIMR